MRTLERNKRLIYYALYESSEPLYDEYGNETGEYRDRYSYPVPLRINVSGARGSSVIRQFGEIENYDKTMVTDDVNCPINENTILWIDEFPTRWIDLENETWEKLADENWLNLALGTHDYVVQKVSKTLNGIQYAVRKVKVDG